MARLEALLTIGPRPSSQPSFTPVTHKPPSGVLSNNPFLLPSVPSGQAFGPDRTHTITATTSSSVDMVSPLENLYQDPEPVFMSADLSVSWHYVVTLRRGRTRTRPREQLLLQNYKA